MYRREFAKALIGGILLTIGLYAWLVIIILLSPVRHDGRPRSPLDQGWASTESGRVHAGTHLLREAAQFWRGFPRLVTGCAVSRRG